jgi:hypothetical protein
VKWRHTHFRGIEIHLAFQTETKGDRIVTHGLATTLNRFFLIALILGFLGDKATAQGNTADLQGVITDPSGSTVSGALVRVENPAVGFARETTSGDTGAYTFLSLPPARYTIRVEAKGFRNAVVLDFQLTVGQKAQLPIRLEISPLAEALNILVSNTEVETTRSSLATTIDQRAIEDLPINGRSYIQFTLLDSATTRDNQPVLAPAPTSGLNINGQRACANFVSIDGADAIDNSVNGVRATLSQEAIQEFQILKSGYAPEYGRASSAVINLVSKQGTNQWRGDVFGYLRSRKVSATNGCFRHQVLLSRRSHSPGSYLDRRDRVEERKWDILQRQKNHPR